MQHKICSRCKINKPYSEYFKDNRRKIGIRCRCKECCKKTTYEWREKNKSEYNNYAAHWRAKNPDRQHATEIKRRYSLNIEQFNEMLKKQNYCCAICGNEHKPKKRGRLYVDHCHCSKKIRGLLCGNCNSAIGLFKEDHFVCSAAAEYLKSFYL